MPRDGGEVAQGQLGPHVDPPLAGGVIGVCVGLGTTFGPPLGTAPGQTPVRRVGERDIGETGGQQPGQTGADASRRGDAGPDLSEPDAEVLQPEDRQRRGPSPERRAAAGRGGVEEVAGFQEAATTLTRAAGGAFPADGTGPCDPDVVQRPVALRAGPQRRLTLDDGARRDQLAEQARDDGPVGGVGLRIGEDVVLDPGDRVGVPDQGGEAARHRVQRLAKRFGAGRDPVLVHVQAAHGQDPATRQAGGARRDVGGQVRPGEVADVERAVRGGRRRHEHQHAGPILRHVLRHSRLPGWGWR